VLDRAVMEHNLLASSKIYNNITFRGLGALLDLTPGAAETMARKMIEQGRLRGSIDQVDKLIWFQGGHEDDDAQGKAGGLGDVEQQTEDTGAPFTKHWDSQSIGICKYGSRPLTSEALSEMRDIYLSPFRLNRSYSIWLRKAWCTQCPPGHNLFALWTHDLPY
jgi:hypothetical protein